MRLRHVIYLFFILVVAPASAQIVEIPDPNLREVIREVLQLPVGSPITQQEMLNLQRLNAPNRDIANLTGLEYATNLTFLGAWANPISDLTPLSDLIKLKGLDLGGCQIIDLTPLQNLTQLTYLQLSRNPIVDLTPLASLTQLQELKLQDIPALDYSPIEHLSIPRLIRNYPCELPYLPIQERLQNRTFPSVFAAWGNVHYSQVNNLEHLSHTERLALHDLNWNGPYFELRYFNTAQGIRLGGIIEDAQEIRDNLLSLNPNMLFLVGIEVRAYNPDRIPEDFPYWLRDKNGNRVSPYMNETDLFLIDITQSGMQDIIVQQAVSAAECGLFDGIFFDWFGEDGNILVNETATHYELFYSLEEEQQAKDNILKRIRAAVREDFLVIINTNRSKIPRRAWGINGTFMETLRDNQWNSDKEPYTHKGLKEIEDTLLWSEENLREPQINCLEGWGIPTEPPDSPTNLRFMRVFTTMSLTLSDGYVLYGMEDSHQHIWYDFWDADLGRPVAPKALLYQNIDGLFIREFTNGWAVYNRSGQPQTITLPESATPVSDRGDNVQP